MGIRSTIVEFASAQAAAAGAVRERAELRIDQDDKFFVEPWLGDLVIRDVFGLYERTALSVGIFATPNHQPANEDLNGARF